MVAFTGNNDANFFIDIPNSNDSYDGRGAIDTIQFTAITRASATITKTGAFDGIVVRGDESDGFTSVENLRFFDGEVTYDPQDDSAVAYRLYQGVLGRKPDEQGRDTWTEALKSGISVADAATLMLRSAEAQTRFAGLDDAGFIRKLYVDTLGRPGSEAEVQSWLVVLNTPNNDRGDVVRGFVQSEEYILRTNEGVFAGLFDVDTRAVQAVSLYNTAFGRAPEKEGAIAAKAYLEAGGGRSLQQLGDVFDESREFTDRHGGETDAQYVQALYRDGLGRAAAEAEVAGWVSRLQQGDTRGEVAASIAGSEEAFGRVLAQGPGDGLLFA